MMLRSVTRFLHRAETHNILSSPGLGIPASAAHNLQILEKRSSVFPPGRSRLNLPNIRSYSSETGPVVAQEESSVVAKINDQIRAESHGRLFAVVRICGRQFKITSEDVIALRGYWAPDIGDRIRLEKVLLVGSSDFTLVGKPLLPRDLVRIEATVIEKTMSDTKLRFRMIARKDYRRLNFYKIPYSMVRINLIKFDGLIDKLKDIEGLRPATLW